MTMEDKELRFWDDVDKLPNNMEHEEWDKIRAEYKERIRLERINGISSEKALVTDICMRFEVSELNDIRESGVWPKEILSFCTVIRDDKGEWFFHSKKWEVNLHKAEELFKYEEEAKQREYYYNAIGNDVEDDRYEMWVEYKATLDESGGEFGIPPEETMKEFLVVNKWEEGSDGEWVRCDWDYNQTGSLSTKDAYFYEVRYQKSIEDAKNQNPDDLIMKFDEDKES